MAAKYGLLIDYEYCSGCRTCEVACKAEHNFPVGKWGIRVFEDGPWQKGDDETQGNNFNWNKIPVPTDLCDLCSDRVEQGRDPFCVHHCLADCIEFGTVEELREKVGTKAKQVLWIPTE